MQNSTSETLPLTTAIFSKEMSAEYLCLNETENEYDPTVLRDRIITQGISAILMFGLGCSAEAKLMWNYIKQPKQFATALFLQLIIMPWLGFSLSQAFQMSQAEVIGVIIQASCPGGIYSNIISYYINGNINLSVVMTTVSTIFALGSMPLWLFVFPLIINVKNNCLQVPFDALGYALLVLIVPLGLGMILKYKLPEKSKIITKICTASGSAVVVIYAVVVAATAENSFLGGFSWKIIVVALLQLLLGFLLGYLATRVPALSFSVASRRTVAVETALQNGALGTTIVLVSFGSKSPVVAPILFFPLIYSGVQLFAGFFMVVIYLVLKWKGKCTSFIPLEEDKVQFEGVDVKDEKQIKIINEENISNTENGYLNTAYEDYENNTLTRL